MVGCSLQREAIWPGEGLSSGGGLQGGRLGGDCCERRFTRARVFDWRRRGGRRPSLAKGKTSAPLEGRTKRKGNGHQRCWSGRRCGRRRRRLILRSQRRGGEERGAQSIFDLLHQRPPIQGVCWTVNMRHFRCRTTAPAEEKGTNAAESCRVRQQEATRPTLLGRLEEERVESESFSAHRLRVCGVCTAGSRSSEGGAGTGLAGASEEFRGGGAGLNGGSARSSSSSGKGGGLAGADKRQHDAMLEGGSYL